MANGKGEKLASNVSGKADTRTVEVLVEERGKAMGLALACKVAPILDSARVLA